MHNIIIIIYIYIYIYIYLQAISSSRSTLCIIFFYEKCRCLSCWFEYEFYGTKLLGLRAREELDTHSQKTHEVELMNSQLACQSSVCILLTT